MKCPKCSGLVIFESGEGRCVNCGTRPTLEQMAERILSVVKEEKKGMTVKNEKPPILEYPKDGCTSYSQTTGGPKYYCGDPRKPGSKYCEEHLKKLRARKAVKEPRIEAILERAKTEPQTEGAASSLEQMADDLSGADYSSARAALFDGNPPPLGNDSTLPEDVQKVLARIDEQIEILSGDKARIESDLFIARSMKENLIKMFAE